MALEAVHLRSQACPSEIVGAGWPQGQRFLTVLGRFQITAAPLALVNPNPHQPISRCHFQIRRGLLGGGAASSASWSRVLPTLRRVPQLARTRIPGEVRRAAPEPRAPGCSRLRQVEAGGGGGGTVTTGVEGEARAPRAPRHPR